MYPPESSIYYLYEQRQQPNIGELINSALDKLAKANMDKLSGEDRKGMFSDIDFNSAILGETQEKNTRLQYLLSLFAGDDTFKLTPENLENEHVTGDAYRALLERFATEPGKKEGEFYTPKEISALLVKLTKGKPGSTIYDPACGSGSLLIHAAKEMGDANPSLYGQEVNGRNWLLAKINMYFHHFDNATVCWGDTLQNPKLKEADQSLMKFDIVIAHPPFSLKWQPEKAMYDSFKRFERGIPPSDKADWAFISHMLKATRENSGKMGVLVPLGVLFRGAGEGRIRQQVIEENLLEAVIGLPANLLYGTGIPVAILVFNKNKTHDQTLFIDASAGFENRKTQTILAENTANQIVSVYNDFREGKLNVKEIEKSYAHIATLEEIRKHNFNLNIPMYVNTAQNEVKVDIEKVKYNLRQLEGELRTVRKQMEFYLEKLGIGSF